MTDFPNKKFDAFLSHSRKYAEAVHQLAGKLEAAGIRCWLDDEEILGGDQFIGKMEEGIKQSKYFLAIFEREQPSGWFADEIELAQIQEKAEQDFKIIPVLLPGADASVIPDFLQSKNNIVFKNGLDDAATFEKLIKSIKRTKEIEPTETLTQSIKGALTQIPRPTNVIGREAQLQAIGEAFKDKKDIILVNGLGGIGKTTVALEYAWRQKNFDHVAWLEITNKIPEAFINNTRLKASLKINEQLAKIPPQQLSTEGFKLMLWTMNQLPGDNLLILDNANDHDDLLNQMDAFQELNWKILFTSRIDSSKLDNDLHPIAIDELPLEDAVTLFKTHFDFTSDQTSTVESLVTNLHLHTLLIELVARAGNKQRIPLTELAQLVETEFIHHKKLNDDAIRTGKYAGRKGMPKTERITLYIQKFFQEITALTEEEKQYLRYFCLLPSNDYTKEELLDFFQIGEDDNWAFNDLLGELVKKGVVSFKASGEKNTYKLHALMQDVAIKRLKPDGVNCEILISFIEDKLYIDVETQDIVGKFQWIPFGESILENIADLKNEKICELEHWLAWAYFHAGDYLRSKELLENALKTALLVLEPSDRRISMNKSTLAILYETLGEFEKAELLLKESLVSGIENLGEDDSAVAKIRSNLANVYINLKEYEKAKDLLKRALAFDLNFFGEHHPSVANKRSNLAAVYGGLGEYEKAKDLLKKALASNLKKFEEDHPNVARTRSSLANVHISLEEYEKAKNLLEKALTSDLKNFGTKHHRIATRKNNLGVVYFHMQDKVTARQYFHQAYDLLQNLFGAEHPSTKTVKKWLDSAS